MTSLVFRSTHIAVTDAHGLTRFIMPGDGETMVSLFQRFGDEQRATARAIVASMEDIPWRPTISGNEFYLLFEPVRFRRSMLNADDFDQCPICAGAWRNRKVVRTDCGHLFCVKCFFKWVTREKANCPVCRDPIGLDVGLAV